MSDTELIVSHPLWIKVDLTDLDFNPLAEAIWVTTLLRSRLVDRKIS